MERSAGMQNEMMHIRRRWPPTYGVLLYGATFDAYGLKVDVER